MPQIDKRSMSAVGQLSKFFNKSADEVESCLSITNISDDATPREVHILFSGCPGYIKSYLAFDSNEKRLWGLVHFASEQSAMQAAESRKGTTWDGFREIRIDLGRPAWTTSTGVELKVVQRDRVSKLHAQAERQKSELTSPAAQLAYCQLRAAVNSRKADLLKDAIEQGRAAGLEEAELKQAKDALSLVNIKRGVRSAASCEQRAHTMMTKALANVADAEHCTLEHMESLRQAHQAGKDTAKICSVVGLRHGELRMKALARELSERIEILEANSCRRNTR